LSGRGIKKRQEQLQSQLQEEFEECCGKEVDQTTILDFLCLDDKEKSLTTRVVTAAFPSCKIQRIQKKGQSKYPFYFSLQHPIH
jgi:hypothetical protein